tara:strand:+ start:159 stop:1373 length:1215 start_codon:yes stop_codon:yes gene_type:complete
LNLEIEKYFTVSELNDSISATIRTSYSNFWIAGEVSDFHYHESSGHMYFSIKDEKSEIRAVMFKTSNQFLNFNPKSGSMVKIFGSVSVFEKRGQIQIVCSLMEELGVGDLYKKFELLKQKLNKEGLFDPEIKKKLPHFPMEIGIITSGSGAALQDIIKVMKRRSPHIKIYFRSSSVQGSKAVKDIAKSIKEFIEFGKVDLIILGRGGGSIEDLWAFNEETVARAIFNCPIPIISAVGHETDFTISDMVADLRAPTPSAAAEMITDKSSTLINTFINYFDMVNNKFLLKIEYLGQKLDYFHTIIMSQKPQKKIENQIKQIQDHRNRFINLNSVFLANLVNRLNYFEKQLYGLSPNYVLKRGYSIATDKNGRIIFSQGQLKIGDKFYLKTGDGSMEAEKVSKIHNR